MSKTLLTATRALKYDDDWRDLLTTACTALGVEYSQPIGLGATLALASENLLYVGEDGAVCFDKVDDQHLLATVDAAQKATLELEPEPKPEPTPESPGE